MWWELVWAVLSVVALVTALSVALPLSTQSPVLPTVTLPPPEPSPSVSVSVVLPDAVLWLDEFAGDNGVSLETHVPNEPAGTMAWESAADFSAFSLTLNGSQAAVNSNLSFYDIFNSTMSYDGANQSSGLFSERGYDAVMDALQSRVTFQLPTTTPDLMAVGTLVTVNGALLRTSPQKDLLLFTLTYNVANAVPTAGSYQFRVRSITDEGGPAEKTVTIYDSRVVNRNPPLDTPIEVELSLLPQGQCHVHCLALGVDHITTNPRTPVLIPSAGYVLEALVISAQGLQNIATLEEPLHVLFSNVDVRALKPNGTSQRL